MKAVLFHEHSGADRLVCGDTPTPAAAPGEALVRVRATTVNRADTVVRRGYPGLTIPLPHILGGDIAGTVESVALDVTGWDPGNRVFNHRDDDVAARVREVAPGGVDVVLDCIGPATYPQSFGLVRKGGTLLWCGMISGREVTVNIQALYLKHASIRGLYLGSKAELRDVVAAVTDGSVRPHVRAVMPLADAAKAHEMMESGSLAGKIVLVP